MIFYLPLVGDVGNEGAGAFASPALASRPDAIRCLIRCSSSSVIVPFSPSYLTPASF